MADTKYIWDYLNSYYNNEYSVAGIMGNLQAESGLINYRLQNDFTEGYIKSIEYTNNVNNGTISEYTFVHDSKGYGLAQWTYYTRKQTLYGMTVGSGKSIDDLDIQLDLVCNEIPLSIATNWSSVRESSDWVLHNFENPAEQGESVEIYRASLGQAWYDLYSGSEPEPPHPPEPPIRIRRKSNFFQFMLQNRII